MKRTDIKKILVIGSGPIVIGQAAENSTMPESGMSVTSVRKAMRSY